MQPRRRLLFTVVLIFAAMAQEPAAPKASTSLALERPTYRGGDRLTARFVLRNTQSEPLVLDFGTAQEFDLVIMAESSGQELLRWSEGKSFAQVLHSVSVSGEKTWTAEVTLPRGAANGRYQARMFLAIIGAPTRYEAKATFSMVK